MTAKHTPGPWEADHSDIWSRSGKKFIAATMEDGEAFKGVSLAEAEANARLIAAAPELLAALKACRAALDAVIENNDGDVFGTHHNAAMDAILAADKSIAKAEGRS